MKVTVTRHTRNYRRSVNGGWLSNGTSQSGQFEVDIEDLHTWSIGDGWLEVVWPDGHAEKLFASRLGFNYPPEPIGERLSAIFKK